MRIRKFEKPKTLTDWLNANNLEIVVDGTKWFVVHTDNTVRHMASFICNSGVDGFIDYMRHIGKQRMFYNVTLYSTKPEDHTQWSEKSPQTMKLDFFPFIITNVEVVELKRFS